MNPRSARLRAPARSVRGARDLERDLFEGARRVFGRLGYAEASVEDILLEARVSRHSFYRLFQSKSDIFLRLVDRHTGELVDRLVGAVASQPEPEDKLRVGVGVFFEWIRDLGPFWGVMETQERLASRRDSHARVRTVERIGTLVSDEASRVFGDSPDPALVEAIIAGVEALGRRLLTEPEDARRFESLRDTAVRLMQRSLEPVEGEGR